MEKKGPLDCSFFAAGLYKHYKTWFVNLLGLSYCEFSFKILLLVKIFKLKFIREIDTPQGQKLNI